MLVYSITSRSSFEEVSTFHQQILRVSHRVEYDTAQAHGQVKDKDYFPVVVVANKCDLEYERQVQPHGQLVKRLMRDTSSRGRGARSRQALQRAVHRDVGQAAR